MVCYLYFFLSRKSLQRTPSRDTELRLAQRQNSSRTSRGLLSHLLLLRSRHRHPKTIIHSPSNQSIVVTHPSKKRAPSGLFFFGRFTTKRIRVHSNEYPLFFFLFSTGDRFFLRICFFSFSYFFRRHFCYYSPILIPVIHPILCPQVNILEK